MRKFVAAALATSVVAGAALATTTAASAQPYVYHPYWRHYYAPYPYLYGPRPFYGPYWGPRWGYGWRYHHPYYRHW